MSFSRVLVSDPGKPLLEKVWLDVVTVILIITTIVLMFPKEPAASWLVACALLWCWPVKWLCWLENQLLYCFFLCRVLNWQVLTGKALTQGRMKAMGCGQRKGPVVTSGGMHAAPASLQSLQPVKSIFLHCCGSSSWFMFGLDIFLEIWQQLLWLHISNPWLCHGSCPTPAQAFTPTALRYFQPALSVRKPFNGREEACPCYKRRCSSILEGITPALRSTTRLGRGRHFGSRIGERGAILWWLWAGARTSCAVSRPWKLGWLLRPLPSVLWREVKTSQSASRCRKWGNNCDSSPPLKPLCPWCAPHGRTALHTLQQRGELAPEQGWQPHQSPHCGVCGWLPEHQLHPSIWEGPSQWKPHQQHRTASQQLLNR